MLATKEQIIQMENESKQAKNTKIELNSEAIKGIKDIIKGHKSNKFIHALNSIKVKVINNNVIQVTYSDSDLMVEKMLIANVPHIKNKEFLLPISLFTALKNIKKNDSFIFQEINKEVMVLTRNNLKQIVNIMDINEYPQLPLKKEKFTTIETGNGYEYFQYDDLEILNKAIISTIKSESRPILQDVSIQNNSVVSTDSHRLYQSKTIFKSEKGFTICPSLIKKAMQICNKNMFLKLVCSDSLMSIQDDYTTKIYARRKEGNYPDVSRLIPTDFRYEIKINNIDQLLEFTKNLKATDKNNLMMFELDVTKQEIHLEVNTENGKAEIDIPVIVNKHDNDVMKFGFNYKYFVDGILQLDKKPIIMNIHSSLRPFTLQKQNSDKEIALILPVKKY